MHDCPCCGHAVYTTDLLCSECQANKCEPNGSGNYDDCQVPCFCGSPALSDFYFCVVYVGQDGETTYTDGYVCDEHAVEDADVYAPAGADVLEFELLEIPR